MIEVAPPTRDGLWPMPPGPPHEEGHAPRRRGLRDFFEGLATGPVMPFAVAAGLAVAGARTERMLLGGVLALVGMAVLSGVARYLALRNRVDHYAAERVREYAETEQYPDREQWEVAAILHRYGVRGDALRAAVDSICTDRDRWVDFMMRFELDLREPDAREARIGGLAIAAGHVAGGLPAMLPFGLLDWGTALGVSAGLMMLGLGVFGAMRAQEGRLPPMRGAVEALLAGAAAGAATIFVGGLLTL